MCFKAIRENISIFSILVLSLVLRLVSLNQSLWLDEATSAFLVRDFSFLDIITKFSPGDFNPPLYYFILKTWSLAFGTSEIGLRSMSIVVGIGSITITYLLGKKIFNRNVGLISSILLATSGLHIYFSQEARMYILASFFVLITMLYFVKTFSSDRVGNWIGFGIFLTASFMTHYLTVLILPVFWIYGLIKKFKFSWWNKFIMSHIILVVTFLLWLPIFIVQFRGGLNVQTQSPIWWNVLGQFNIKEFLLVPIKFMIGRVGFENRLVYGFLVLSIGLIFFYLLYPVLRSIRKSLLVWLWLIVPSFLGIIISLKLSIFSYFRFLFLLPAFYILVAFGVNKRRKNLRNVFILIILFFNLSFSLYYLFNPKFYREDWRGLVTYLISASNEEEKSVVIFPTYAQMEAIRYYDKEGKLKINGPALIYDKYTIIWLMRYAQPIFDPEDKVRTDIEKLGYQKLEEKDFNGVVVWKYHF